MAGSLKPLVIPIFIPHSGCPHQCAFCNQSIITNKNNMSRQDGFRPVIPELPLPDNREIDGIIKEHLKYKGMRKRVEVAFFGGNFLGLPGTDILGLLNCVQPWISKGVIDGVRFSTRPDTVSFESLELIRPYNVCAVELGVQSMNNQVLSASLRGHTDQDTFFAVDLLRREEVDIGVQLMVGLPGDTPETLMESTQKVSDLGPDFVRIYPLMVLKGSRIEKWFHQGAYTPLTLEESLELVKQMYLIFSYNKVKVIRMGLQASDTMEDESMVVAGPWHPAFGHLVFSRIMFDRACKAIEGCQSEKIGEKIVLKVHPRCESRLRGDKNTNIVQLRKKYPSLTFSICTDKQIEINHVQVV